MMSTWDAPVDVSTRSTNSLSSLAESFTGPSPCRTGTSGSAP
ncbi:hypothetical protein EES42_31275 [Streptomyces sp. ADI95-17]|nr:hypothetical protein EES42_31275 [Streptomyces sp. ADI95-17]